MLGDKKTKSIDNLKNSSNLSALYELLRSNSDSSIRKQTATHLLQLIEKGEDIDRDKISDLFKSEKVVSVAAELKRVLNKVKIRKMFLKDPAFKYDKKLSPEEEASIVKEIEKLKRLYDKSSKEEGAFEKKYQIIEKIADGGMGRIYRAIRLQDKQILAIKFLLLDKLSRNSDPERIISRFKRESEILKRLYHPNIVRGFEYGEADGEYFLVMEYVEGGTLEDRIKQGSIDLQKFNIIVLQLCGAVEYLHRNNIIHRDIKPGNILINDNNGEPLIKLCDFGLAKDKKSPKLSKFAFTAGTGEYSSPQQLHDARDADERDDIFSLGKTFYEMLTGRIFKNDEPYFDINVGDDIGSKKINEIIRKCASYERKNRWQNVRELKAALKD